MKLETNHWKRNEKKKDYMETKLQATKKPMGQQWNQRGNLKIFTLRKMTKYKYTESTGCSKSNS